MPGPRRSDLGADPALHGRRLLVVDDNATNRLVVVRHAERWGMLTHETASPAEAMTWIERGDPFDLAVLDVRMPEMDGLTLARAIRRHRSARALPLLLLSSLGRREAGAEEAGVDAVLAKPIKPSQLRETLIALACSAPGASGAGPSPSPAPADPGRATDAGAVRALQLDPQMARRHPLRLLLAEDNAVNQMLALRLLERLGYGSGSVDVAANGLEALQALDRQRYDVVLLDVQMPELDGLEATRRICRRWPAPADRPRLVAMTANALQGDRESCLGAGMDDYISKPIDVGALVAALARCAAAPAAVAPDAQSALHTPDARPALDSPVVLDQAALNGLLEATGADPAFLAALIGAYLADTPAQLETIAAAAAGGRHRSAAGARAQPQGQQRHPRRAGPGGTVPGAGGAGRGRPARRCAGPRRRRPGGVLRDPPGAAGRGAPGHPWGR